MFQLQHLEVCHLRNLFQVTLLENKKKSTACCLDVSFTFLKKHLGLLSALQYYQHLLKFHINQAAQHEHILKKMNKYESEANKKAKKQKKTKQNITYLNSRKPYPIKIFKQKFKRCDTMQIHKGFDGRVFQTNVEGGSLKFKNAVKSIQQLLNLSKESKYSKILCNAV